MSKRNRTILIVVALLLVLALPTAALANTKKWMAGLSTTNELHEVVGSQAGGSMALRATATGYHFKLVVVGLSGAPTGAHIHGPATAAENAPVLISLCGAPAPAALPTCGEIVDGKLIVEGDLTSALFAQWGLGGAYFRDLLNTSMTYVNVHTELNPMGEVRGQIVPFIP